jgi:magnesium chelatase family protein
MEQMNFSARAHDRILKVARTIADLAGYNRIQREYILIALPETMKRITRK